MEPAGSPPPPRRRRLMLSVRVLMALVLLIGGGLGWALHRARVQRDAVAAIVRAGGNVQYDWEVNPDGNPSGKAEPGYPSWLVQALGTDLFQVVTGIILIPRPGEEGTTDAVMPAIGRLDRVERLYLSGSGLTGAGLGQLRGLTRLRELDLDVPLGDADLAHLAGLTSLEVLEIRREGLGDRAMAHLKGLTRLRSLTLRKGRVTDSGLAHLAGLTGIDYLMIPENPITDAGLAQFRGMAGLKVLGVSGTQVSTLEPIKH